MIRVGILSTLEAAVGETDLARFGLGAPLADLAARFWGRSPALAQQTQREQDGIFLGSSYCLANKRRRGICIECRVYVRDTLGIRTLCNQMQAPEYFTTLTQQVRTPQTVRSTTKNTICTDNTR